jgi:hypothetical protein
MSWLILLTQVLTGKALRAHWGQRPTTFNLRMVEDIMHFTLENTGTELFHCLWYLGSSDMENGKGAKRSEADQGRENYVILLINVEFNNFSLTTSKRHELYLLTLDNELCLAPFGTPHVRLPIALFWAHIGIARAKLSLIESRECLTLALAPDVGQCIPTTPYRCSCSALS